MADNILTLDGLIFEATKINSLIGRENSFKTFRITLPTNPVHPTTANFMVYFCPKVVYLLLQKLHHEKDWGFNCFLYLLWNFFFSINRKFFRWRFQ